MPDGSAQIKVEQERVSAMYERLDAEVSEVRARLAELSPTPPAERAAPVAQPAERAASVALSAEGVASPALPAERAVPAAPSAERVAPMAPSVERVAPMAPSAERAALAAMLARRLSDLRAAESALCFGRIDHDDGTTLHIGRRGLWVDGEPLLVDWRAEAARPFYAATPAYPMGLRRRRHLRVEGRTVRGLADEILDGSAPTADDVPGDGPLAEALSAVRTGRMRAAVTTLQAEQDAIVRSPDRGVTVVQGGPGTGKTVVALHRAAYVLFAFPAAAAQGVLVVGPDARFLDYISQVLPSLGENGVRLATRSGITGIEPASGSPGSPASGSPGSSASGPSGPLTSELPASPASVPLEVSVSAPPVLPAAETAPPASASAASVLLAFEADGLARLKGRAELADGLARVVCARQPAAAPVLLPVGDDRVELPAAAVAEALAAARGLPHNRGRGVFKEHLVAGLVRERARAAEAELARIDAETAELVGFDLDEAVAADLRSLGLDAGRGLVPTAEGDDPGALMRDEELDHAITALWPVLTPAALVTGLLAAPAAYLASPGSPAAGGWRPADHAALRRLPGAPWTAADLALLDEAAELLDGPPEQVYGHVVVDEAQELTEMDWRAVMRRCPARSMTLVGDFAQAGPGSTVLGWADALRPHVGARFTAHTLAINYRTTAEILDATRDLLASIAPEQAPARSLRHGEPPRVRRVASAALSTVLLDELRTQAAAYPGELVAVIAADATAARLVGTAVAGLSRVVPVSEARGLEFDSVLVVYPDEIVSGRPSGRRDLYVALTRATRRVCVLHTAHRADG